EAQKPDILMHLALRVFRLRRVRALILNADEFSVESSLVRPAHGAGARLAFDDAGPAAEHEGHIAKWIILRGRKRACDDDQRQNYWSHIELLTVSAPSLYGY